MKNMKTPRGKTLAIVILSFTVMFMSGCVSRRIEPPVHNTVVLKQLEEIRTQLYEIQKIQRIEPPDVDSIIANQLNEINTLIRLAKDNLAKGEPFKVLVNGRVVNGTKGSIYNTKSDPSKQFLYWLQCITPAGSLPAGYLERLDGLLVLTKVDTTHVDVVYRWGSMTTPLSPIAICIDDYDVGVVEWDQQGSKEE